MKKTLYSILCIFFLLLIGYFVYGFYLNLTLKEKYEPSNKTFHINVFETDNTYKNGICKKTIKIYPWESPAHQPVKPSEYGQIKVDCTVQEREPFGFNYIEAWGNEKEIIAPSAFLAVRKLFFKSPLSVCLEGIDLPLPVKESIYSTDWGFNIKGIEYSITLDGNLKDEWKILINNFFEQNKFPKSANLIKGSSCQDYNDSNIIKKYPVTYKYGWR